MERHVCKDGVLRIDPPCAQQPALRHLILSIGLSDHVKWYHGGRAGDGSDLELVGLPVCPVEKGMEKGRTGQEEDVYMSIGAMKD
jgi:hypothetical protein